MLRPVISSNGHLSKHSRRQIPHTPVGRYRTLRLFTLRLFTLRLFALPLPALPLPAKRQPGFPQRTSFRQLLSGSVSAETRQASLQDFILSVRREQLPLSL
jgi:hypothetical protein